jgi:multiple sugar transport system substrate-binding protein
VFDSLNAVALAPSIGDNQAKMQDDVTNALTEVAAGRQKVQDAIPTAAQQVNELLK